LVRNKGGPDEGIDEGLIISWFVGVDVGDDKVTMKELMRLTWIQRLLIRIGLGLGLGLGLVYFLVRR
jgi:hypothetical protein